MTASARLGAIAMLAFAPAAGASAKATDTDPTCSDDLGIAVHGQHVIGDYVTGVSHDELDWPPQGSEVGEVVSANGGAAVPGGPGPGFHFLHGIAPGASFCTSASSWGVPRGNR